MPLNAENDADLHSSESPFFSFRGNEYADSIPGDNLYAANNHFKYNNSNKICNRYSEVKEALSNGTMMSHGKNWNILKEQSNCEDLGFDNLQFIQYIPSEQKLKISIYNNDKQAYLNEPVMIDLTTFFQE